MDNLLQVYIGIVTFYDFGAGLQGADDVLDAFQFFRLYLVGLVQQDDVTELNLLDDKAFDILFVNALAGQTVAASKFALQA